MNLTKLVQAFTDLVKWVKDGLATKQGKVLVKSVPPVDTEGADGDICVVVDAS